MELVSKAEAYDHLRLDFDSNGSPDDAWLDVFIPAISEAIANWLKDDWRLWMPELDSNGDPVLDSNEDPIPADPLVAKWSVKAAVLIELERQFRFRGGEGGETDVPADAGWGYTLGKGAVALLTPLRKPTVA